MRRQGAWPRGLPKLGLASAVPLILVPAVVNGFVLGPIWYVWLGLALRRAS
jgi:hypothetical protein